MTSRIDVAGIRYGRLLAREYAGKNRHGQSMWLCNCDCGNEVIIRLYSLRSGNTQSCGCYAKECSRKSGKSCSLSVNHSFFRQWSPRMAWVLGFWAADGHVSISKGHDPNVGFSQKDDRVLEKIKLFLGSMHSIVPRKNGVFSITYSSKRQYEDLCIIFNQDVQRKSKTLLFPSIPTGFEKAFIRGFIDGDGSLYWSSHKYASPRMSALSASEAFIDGLLREICVVSWIEMKKRET